MPHPQNKPHAKCGAKGKRSGLPCQAQPMPNGKCYHHGGKVGEGHGAPRGNLNAKSHGLYSQGGLGPVGMEMYRAASELSNQELAEETACFLVAKVAEAFATLPPEAIELLTAHINDLAANGLITQRKADRYIERLHPPRIEALATAIRPLAGLLSFRAPQASDQDDEALQSLFDTLDASRKETKK